MQLVSGMLLQPARAFCAIDRGRQERIASQLAPNMLEDMQVFVNYFLSS